MILYIIILLLILYIICKKHFVEEFKCLRNDYFIDPENRCKDIRDQKDCDLTQKCSWGVPHPYKYPLFIKENFTDCPDEEYPEPVIYGGDNNKYSKYCEKNFKNTSDKCKKDFCKKNYLKCPSDCKNECSKNDFYKTGFCVGAPHHKTSNQCCNDYGSQNGYRFI
jgi:hypothetical protein